MLKLISKYQGCENALETAKRQVLRKHFPSGNKPLNRGPFSTLLERWNGAEQALRKKIGL